MSHQALDIECWQILSPKKKTAISFNNKVLFMSLNIDAIKFYFFLKERYGSPIIDFSTVSHFFSKKDISTGRDWCYVFHTNSDFILITGDEQINIAVLSINEPPEKNDVDFFVNMVNETLDNYDLSKYDDFGYNLYLNYSCLLKNIIDEKKAKVKQKLPFKPELIKLHLDELNSNDPEIVQKKLEYNKEYNEWLKAVLELATQSIQLQIILPIFFESLIDLGFRVKLQKQHFIKSRTYEFGDKKLNIFEYFERLPLYKKLNEIGDKCARINKDKLIQLSKQVKNYNTRRKRNKLLHGNSLFLKDLNRYCYFDKEYLIGFPDLPKAKMKIAESFQSTLINEDIKQFVNIYESHCNSFIGIFEDNGYFKSLVNGIVFGHNPNASGTIRVGIYRVEDLFLPEN